MTVVRTLRAVPTSLLSLARRQEDLLAGAVRCAGVDADRRARRSGGGWQRVTHGVHDVAPDVTADRMPIIDVDGLRGSGCSPTGPARSPWVPCALALLGVSGLPLDIAPRWGSRWTIPARTVTASG